MRPNVFCCCFFFQVCVCTCMCVCMRVCVWFWGGMLLFFFFFFELFSNSISTWVRENDCRNRRYTYMPSPTPTIPTPLSPNKYSRPLPPLQQKCIDYIEKWSYHFSIYSRTSIARTQMAFTMAESNLFFESLRNSSNNSSKQIFRGFGGDFLNLSWNCRMCVLIRIAFPKLSPSAS